MPLVPHYIAGQSVTAEGRRLPVFNPATGEVAAEVAAADPAMVDRAIQAASAALPIWRATSLATRTQVMFRLQNLLVTHRDELSQLVSSEHGKVPADAAGELTRGIENVEYAAGLIEHLKGEYSEQVSTGVDVHSVRQPVGVVGCITPFNFPLMVPLWMVASAIACGNTVVLKPSEKDPSAVVRIAELFAEAGLPDGVLNVVQGDKEVVDAILDAPEIRAVSFVGSTPIAQYIYQRAAANGKRVQALGGAKNHMIVAPDADLDAAADAAVSAGFGSAGERCMAVSVLVAVGDIADDLVTAVAERMAGVRVGPGTDPTNEMGPLITGEHRAKVVGHIADAATDGATIVVDGRDQDFDGDGFFLGPTLIDHVTTDMRIYTTEVFGPVLVVVRVEGFEQALDLINTHAYGNGAALFTRSGGLARAFEFSVEAGMVGINVPIPVPIGSYSFGGWKNSLFGDTHIYGPESFNFYTRRKVTTSRWPNPGNSEINLHFPSSN